MGLETVTYISDLVATNPTSTDLKSQGDDHIRNLKTAIKTTFPNVAGAVNPSHTEFNYVVGVTSAIQTQINNEITNRTNADALKGAIAGQTWTGTHDYTGATMTIAAPTVGANPVTKTYADALAFNAALPSQTGNAGKVVTTDGVNASWANLPPNIFNYLNFGGF